MKRATIAIALLALLALPLPVTAQEGGYVVHLPLVADNEPVSAEALQIPPAAMPKGYMLFSRGALAVSDWMAGLGARDGYRSQWYAPSDAIVTLDTFVFADERGTARYMDAVWEQAASDGSVFLISPRLGVEVLAFCRGQGQSAIVYSAFIRADRFIAAVRVVSFTLIIEDGTAVLWDMARGEAAQLEARAGDR